MPIQQNINITRKNNNCIIATKKNIFTNVEF